MMDVIMDVGVLCSGVSATSSKVSCIDAEKLVELVRGYPHLYVSSSRDFKDQLKKNNSWKAIAKELGEGCTSIDCQRRFRGLRDTYMKERKRLNTRPSGSSGKTKKVWAYFQVMESLLGEYQANAETHGNMDDTTSLASEAGEESIAGPSSASSDSVLTVPYQPQSKKKSTTATEIDALEEAILTSLNSSNEDTLFGQSVGQTLMRLPNAQKALAKVKIMQILFEAEFVSEQ